MKSEQNADHLIYISLQDVQSANLILNINCYFKTSKYFLAQKPKEYLLGNI